MDTNPYERMNDEPRKINIVAMKSYIPTFCIFLKV